MIELLRMNSFLGTIKPNQKMGPVRLAIPSLLVITFTGNAMAYPQFPIVVLRQL